MAKHYKAPDAIVGKHVRIVCCEATIHGDAAGCVCNIVGKEVRALSRRKPQSGNASKHNPEYNIEGYPGQYIRRSEARIVA